MVKYCVNHKFKTNILSKKYDYINVNVGKIVLSKVKQSINKPVTLLNNDIKNAVKLEKKVTKIKSEKENVKKENEENNIEETISASDEYLPIVYIYNTHQSEKYVDYSVYDASKKLADTLTNNGIESYFEEQSVSAFLQTNNLKYNKSYSVSRKYLDEAKNKYPTISYFFDIHRDSINKDKSTVFYNGKNYAKVLFVVGTDNQNKDGNKKNANKLNDIIKSKVPNISRGIVYHGGKGYNGVYNQDISENVFLIEVGGKDNTKEEVLNTINIIYDSISEYIKGVI